MRWAVPHRTLLWRGILRVSWKPHSNCSFSNASIRCPDDWICGKLGNRDSGRLIWPTLIARVRIAAVMSKEPFSTQLSGSDGSYSQIAVAVSTAAILVIWVITSTSARLTTWPKQLYWWMSGKESKSWHETYGSWFCSADHKGRFRRSCVASIVSHFVVLLEALSRVRVWSCQGIRYLSW